MPPERPLTAQSVLGADVGAFLGLNVAALAAPALAVLLGPAAVVPLVVQGIGVASGVGARLWARLDATRGQDLLATVHGWISEASQIIGTELDRCMVDGRHLITTTFRTALADQLVQARELARLARCRYW